MKVSKEIFSVFCEINLCPEQLSFFKLEWVYKFFFQTLKLFICCFYHFRYKYKGIIARLLYHFALIIKIYFGKQIRMCSYHCRYCI